MRKADKSPKEIAERLELLEKVLDTLPIEIWCKTREGEYLYVNEGFAKSIGRTVETCQGEKDYDIFGEMQATLYRKTDWEAMASGEKGSVSRIEKDGEASVEYKRVFKDKEENVIGVVGCAVNDKAEELREIYKDLCKDTKDNRFKIVFDSAPFGMALYTGNKISPTDVNEKFTQILGISKYTALNTDWRFTMYEDDIKVNERYVNMIDRGEIDSFTLENRYIKPNGEMIHAVTSVLAIGNEFNGDLIKLCILDDITKEKKARDNIEYLDFHDELTGVFNRKYYDSIVDSYDDERFYPLSVVVIDVNELRKINEQHTAAKGNKILKRLAEIIKDNCDEHDIISRTGGDEFVILMPWTEKESVYRAVNRIKKGAAKLAEEIGIDFSIAMGTVVREEKDTTVQELYKRAEDRMYCNKMTNNQVDKASLKNFLVNAACLHSKDYPEHSKNVIDYCQKIGERLKFDEYEMYLLQEAGWLHDLGTYDLSNDEKKCENQSNYERHPKIAYDIIRNIHGYEEIAEVVLCHHEYYDGSGYPRGLAGQQIPIYARIMALAEDFVTAMDKGKTKAEALAMMKEYSGTKYDPDILSIFKDIV